MRRWFFFAPWLGVVLLLLVHGTTASAQQALTVQINALDTSAFPSVRVTTTVLDSTQRPLLNLPPGAFQASVGAQQVPITGVASATDAGLGIAVVLAFDVSGSMQGPPLAVAKDAGKALLGQLGPEDQAAVLAFSDAVRLVQPFTQDRAALSAAIDGLVAGGNTALYSAVAQSAQTAQSSPLPRRAAVLLTDGMDFGGATQVDAAGSLSAASGSGVPFFAVGLGNSIDQPYLEQLAGASRGQFLPAPAPDALNALYQSIGSILRHQYVLTLDAARLSSAGSSTLRITVNAAGASGFADAALQLPQPAVTPLPTVTPVVPTPVPRGPGGQAEGGGSSIVPIVAVAVGLIGAAAVSGVFFWRRRRRAAPKEVDLERVREAAPGPQFPTFGPAAPTAADAYLQLTTPEGERTYPLGDWPVTIGFTSDCTICLPDGALTGWERASIWRREGRYMLHNLSRMGGVLVAGRPATWAILEDGDEVQIGKQRLIFREHPSPPD